MGSLVIAYVSFLLVFMRLVLGSLSSLTSSLYFLPFLCDPLSTHRFRVIEFEYTDTKARPSAEACKAILAKAEQVHNKHHVRLQHVVGEVSYQVVLEGSCTIFFPCIPSGL